MPTNEKASPVNTIIGNITRESVTARECASAEMSGAKNPTRASENTTPSALIISVITRMRFT